MVSWVLQDGALPLPFSKKAECSDPNHGESQHVGLRRHASLDYLTSDMEPKRTSESTNTTRTSATSTTNRRSDRNPWILDGTLTFMLLSFLLGILSAIGHHIFNSHWNGQDIATASWSQTWTNRAGTAFAFLTKMFFVFSASVAFVQQFWKTARSRPIKVKGLDAMFDVLNDALQFFDLALWGRLPVLLSLSIITW